MAKGGRIWASEMEMAVKQPLNNEGVAAVTDHAVAFP
jgi:hypothetical protein